MAVNPPGGSSKQSVKIGSNETQKTTNEKQLEKMKPGTRKGADSTSNLAKSKGLGQADSPKGPPPKVPPRTYKQSSEPSKLTVAQQKAKFSSLPIMGMGGPPNTKSSTFQKQEKKASPEGPQRPPRNLETSSKSQQKVPVAKREKAGGDTRLLKDLMGDEGQGSFQLDGKEVGFMRAANRKVYVDLGQNSNGKIVSKAFDPNKATADDIRAARAGYDPQELQLQMIGGMITLLDNEAHLKQEGILRIAGLESDIKEAQKLLSQGKTPADVFQGKLENTHTLAMTLKRELANAKPLSNEAIIRLVNVANDNPDNLVEAIKEEIGKATEPKKKLLKQFATLLRNIEKNSGFNKMGSQNIAITVGPRLVAGTELESNPVLGLKANDIIDSIVVNYDEIFS